MISLLKQFRAIHPIDGSFRILGSDFLASEPRKKKLHEIIAPYEQELLTLLETSLPARTVFELVLSNERITAVANLLTGIEMYRSTKRLERLTLALVCLTIVLAMLTAVLVWRTFLPTASIKTG